MERFLEFKPLIKSAYYQTIIGTAIDFETEPKSTTHLVELPDRDRLALEISTPESWKKTDPTIVLVHGLCGSHRSHYMKRIAKKLYKSGLQAIRVNLRGCGSGKGLAKGVYHSGCSDDVLEALKDIKRNFPESPIILVGFSLGANVILKLAGELKEKGGLYLRGVIAIGPPVDLLSSARLFTHPKNQIYAKYFIKLLMQNVNFIHSHFKEMPPHNLPKDITLNDFDELYVAPRANFASVLEYYRHSSSKRVVCDIQVPTKILFAKDDPIIRADSLDHLTLSKEVHIYKTKYGGHIGFMGQNIFKDFRWMDKVVLSWVAEWTDNPILKKYTA